MGCIIHEISLGFTGSKYMSKFLCAFRIFITIMIFFFFYLRDVSCFTVHCSEGAITSVGIFYFSVTSLTNQT